MKRFLKIVHWGAMLALVLFPTAARASSHMDAPLIVLDPAANTTDVYAFVSTVGGVKYLTTALAVYPHEEPGIGPNKYNFDPNVLYQIHLASGSDLAAGRATISYQFRFNTRFKSTDTILQSYLGVIQNVDDAAQNLTQTYRSRRLTGETTRSRREAWFLGQELCRPTTRESPRLSTTSLRPPAVFFAERYAWECRDGTDVECQSQCG
jgi:hypothetical protein